MSKGKGFSFVSPLLSREEIYKKILLHYQQYLTLLDLSQ